MTTLSDAKLLALQTLTANTGHVNDLEQEYLLLLITGPPVSSTIDGLWDQVFTEAAIPAGQFNDRAVQYIKSIHGAPPSEDYNAHWQFYWEQGGTPLVPPGPMPPSPGTLIHWFDVTDPTQVFQDVAGTIPAADGLPLRHITNKGLSSNVVTQAGAAPTYQAGYINGLAVAENLTSPDVLSGVNMTGTSPLAKTFVAIFKSDGSAGFPFDWTDVGLDVHHIEIVAAGNFQTRYNGGNEDTTKPVVAEEWLWVLGSINSTLFVSETAGGVVAFGTSSTAQVQGGDVMNLGAFLGQWSEVLVWNNQLSVPDRAAFDAYVTAKYGAQMPFFLPPRLSELSHWLDFSGPGVWQDTAGTIPAADGLPIARVDNRGSDAANFITAPPTQQPIYRTGALNGRPIGDFDHGGTFRRMQAISAGGADPPTTGFTMAVVARLNNPQPGAAGQNELTAFSASYRMDQNNGIVGGRSDVTTLFPTGAAFGDHIEHVNPYDPGSWYLFYVTVDIANVHDFAFTSPGPEVPGTTANPLFTIPAGNQFGVDMITGDAHVAESFWWDAPLNTEERAALVSYVASKYGVFAPAVVTYPQPPFQANLQHWWDFSDRSTLFTDTAGLNPVESDLDTIRRVNDKGTAGDDLFDAASTMTFHQSVVTGYPITRSNIAQAAPRFTSQALATPPGGGTGFAQAMVNRAFAVPPGNGKITQIDNGPSNISFETGFGNWAEEHQLPGFQGSNKAIVINEWVEQVVTDGTTFGAHIVHVSGAADVVLPQGYLSQAGTPVEIFATQIAGEIAEMLVYDRDLSAAEVLTLSAYFDAKYIALPHL